MFLLEGSELFDHRGELRAGGRKVVFDPQWQSGELRARDQSVIEQLSQALGEHLGGEPGDESLELTGPCNAAGERRDDGRGPFAPDDVLEAPICGAVAE